MARTDVSAHRTQNINCQSTEIHCLGKPEMFRHHKKVVVVASGVYPIFLESGQTNELLVAKHKPLTQSEPYIPVSFREKTCLVRSIIDVMCNVGIYYFFSQPSTVSNSHKSSRKMKSGPLYFIPYLQSVTAE